MSRFAALAALALTGTAALAATPAIAPYVATALADPARSDQQGDDARRRAAAVLTFSGVKPDWRVVDYAPGMGYWTRIFTGIVGPGGRVYALWPAAGAKNAEKNLPALMARNLPNVSAEVQTTDQPFVPESVDLFWTVQNYHDAANPRGEAGLLAFNKAVFAALKPGGIYLVIDHVAAPGSGLRDTGTLHRIDPAIVKKQVLAAGFVFVGESKVLRNPKDDHTLKIFDPAIRGLTDQFVYKFRRP